jgi:hypothetical protein
VTTPEGPSRPPRFLLLVFVALLVRFGTVALGLGLAALPPRVLAPDDPAAVAVRERILNGRAHVLEPWFRWDAVWIANIAQHGYAGATDRGGRLGVAFMPAMPVTLALGDLLSFNPFWFAVLVSNLVSAIGTALFAQVAARQLNDPASGWLTLGLLLTFPTAFFYSAPYNESFGLLFTAIALSAWQANRGTVAGLGALGGSLARMTGVALGVAAILDWLRKPQRSTFPRALAVALGSFAGLALFWGFLWWAVDDPFAGLKSQAMWGRRGLSVWNPLYAIESIYDPDLSRPDGARHFAWEAIAVFGFAILGVRALWKRGVFWGVIVLVPVGQMLASGTLLSGHRLVLAALPAFLELADLLKARRTLCFTVLLGFGFAQVLLLNRYVHWQFAG